MKEKIILWKKYMNEVNTEHIKIVLYNNKNDDKHPQQWKRDCKS